jgi:3-oxoacyl-[acyl-carrier protein] reductase
MGGPLEGKIALVTGGARGIGRAVVKRLVRDGAKVVVNYVAHAEAAAEIVEEVAKGGGDAWAVRADVSDPVQIRELFEMTMARFGRLDVVVLSAGAFVAKPFVEISSEEFERVFALNARGVFFVLKEAALRIADGGSIVNISSSATLTRRPGSALQSASKAVGEQLATVLAKELGPRGITVNSVSPGATNTESFVAPADMIELLKKQTPLGRIAEPEDIAGVVAFLVGPDGRWITGQNVQANGGVV